MDFIKLMSSTEYDFLRTNPRLENRIILMGLGGSYAYGTNNENSDIDFRGITLNLPSDLLGLTEFEQYEDENTDTVIYSFNKVVKLLLQIKKVRNKMKIEVRAYQEKDLSEMIKIWNDVVEEGVAFPQEELLNMQTGNEFFASQTYTAVAVNTDTGSVCGLYILHPNNIGRCGHICNASYAVSKEIRGLHIGEKLVSDCLTQGKHFGFGVLQFNAVVATNIHARHLYERLGFVQLGTIPKGFRMKDGHYEDICPYYHEL